MKRSLIVGVDRSATGVREVSKRGVSDGDFFLIERVVVGLASALDSVSVLTQSGLFDLILFFLSVVSISL